MPKRSAVDHELRLAGYDMGAGVIQHQQLGVARAAVQRRLASQDQGAGHAGCAAYQQNFAVVALVCTGFADQ